MDSVLPKVIGDLARRVIEENAAIGRKVAVAESCTGGLVAAALTEVPGSSAVLDRGFVTYSNEAKQEMLGVSEDLIDTFGAVSIAVAWSMAQGALRKSGADVAVAITGVAGPDGGSDQKPVGTVVFACAKRGEDPEETNAELKLFDTATTRADVRLQATLTALELLLP
ncbi:MAG: competence protein [Novosphingobium sp. 28-62-57]|uniref:CinA family protein n=1 Tax=unclassified Novosphingobium TaxID=2644732 RepID=UPI000BCD5FF8|nr:MULTISPECIES: CinA family protein [unclassified Novosphingobium]OYW49551.1 MAG: competence protein [Novosphingobium sp. 12-62-10]OYZ12493.1 MAG: competence protein [Novosphingobium sp. 28-62-57]OZA32087.1 MAG: competence protein [Novosphingobium sp. 17-62-9]HQS69169.1 CinA family protein [Novosphingobium sp.]